MHFVQNFPFFCILLTLIIAGSAAVLFPVKEEQDEK